jgi:hypothetical protein
MHKLFGWALAFALPLTGLAQQGPTLSKRAEGVKNKVIALAPNDRISVIPLQDQEEYGTLLSHDEDAFTFYDVDRKANVTLRYTDVRKVKSGYGGYSSVTRRHTDHTKAVVIALIVVGVLGGVIGAAAASK